MILAMEVPCYIDGINGFNIEGYGADYRGWL